MILQQISYNNIFKMSYLRCTSTFGQITEVHYSHFIWKFTERIWGGNKEPAQNAKVILWTQSVESSYITNKNVFWYCVKCIRADTPNSYKRNVMKETTAWPVHVVGIFPCHSYTVKWQGNFMWIELQHMPNFLLCVIQKNWGVLYVHV